MRVALFFAAAVAEREQKEEAPVRGTTAAAVGAIARNQYPVTVCDLLHTVRAARQQP